MFETIALSQGRLCVQRIKSSDILSKTKPTLVFLHDAIGSIEQWRGFPEKLVAATGCPGLVYDRFGSGGSDPLMKKRTPHYLEEEAFLLPEILHTCRIGQAFLIGHSDGGSIALIAAATCPVDIQLKGIITEAAHVFVEDVTLEGIRQAQTLVDTTDFKEKLSRFHGHKTEALLDGWINTWLAPDYRNWNIEKYLPHITCPSLILQGANDEYGTKSQVEAIVAQVNGRVESLLIPDCAHVPHYQAQEKVLGMMTDFIADIPVPL